jgi:hypothetical protein
MPGNKCKPMFTGSTEYSCPSEMTPTGADSGRTLNGWIGEFGGLKLGEGEAGEVGEGEDDYEGVGVRSEIETKSLATRIMVVVDRFSIAEASEEIP